MKNIITLLLALVLLLGACALADDRADMLVAAAVNELGYSATRAVTANTASGAAAPTANGARSLFPGA